MPIHDDYARITPYELALPGRDFAEDHFGAIGEEARRRGVDPEDPGAFVLLANAGRALREIRGEADDPALIHQYGLILYHAFGFWRSGEPLCLVDTALARHLAEPGPAASSWEPRVKERAAYVQLPQHLFWTRPDPEGPPESVDGFFWSLAPGDRIHILLASGIRGDRAGLSVLPVPGVPLAEAATWMVEDAREGGGDFRSTLPGGDLESLHSIETAGEVLKLAARVLAWLDRFPDRLSGRRGPDGPPWGGEGDAATWAPGAPRPSGLPYKRLGLGSPIDEPGTGGEEA